MGWKLYAMLVLRFEVRAILDEQGAGNALAFILNLICRWKHDEDNCDRILIDFFKKVF